MQKPSLNGEAITIHEVAAILYQAISPFPWFLAIVVEEDLLIVEASDINAALIKLPDDKWHGIAVMVVGSKRMVTRKGGEGAEMIA